MLDAGIAIFNEGRHWHAHEAWEDLWKQLDAPDKDFVQGLITAAALLVHYGRRNPLGVEKHWAKTQARLPAHAPTRWGIDIQGLLDQLRPYVESATRGADAMTLDPGAVRIRRRG
jgi:predicted metal-dependent hydrolase